MRRRVRERSPFPAEETAKLLAVRFDHMPQRLAAALEHLDAPRLLLRNLHLAIGGSLLLHVSVLPGLTRGVMRRIGEIPFDRDVHYHQWTVDTIRHLLRRAGYRPVQTVPLVPAKLRRVPIPERFASRVIVEAVPDAQLIETMHRSEQRNKHLIA